MNVYEEIDQETMMLLLDSLCKRTVEGKQIWENMEYNPISFLQKDIYEKEGACILQITLKRNASSATAERLFHF